MKPNRKEQQMITIVEKYISENNKFKQKDIHIISVD